MRYIRNTIFTVLVLTFSATILSACGATKNDVRFIQIEGDVINYISYNNDKTAHVGKGVPLTEFVERAEVSGEAEWLYLHSSGDGFCVRISWEGAEKAKIYYDKSRGWRIDAPDLPVSTGIVDLDRIVVVAKDSDRGLRIITKSEEEDVVTFGSILTSPITLRYREEGSADTGTESWGKATVYTRQLSFTLSDVYENYTEGGFEIETLIGNRYLTDGGGYFSVWRNEISYTEATGDRYDQIIRIRLR